MRNAGTIRLLTRLACFAPFAGGLILVNWIAAQPPVRRCLTSTLDAAAESLVAGNTITAHIDMLDLKPIWIEHVQIRPDVIVLGSSRVAQVPHDWFRPRAMLNLAVLAGDFEDAVAIFQKCLDAGMAPKLVLLELNPTLALEGKARDAPALAPFYRRAMLRYRAFSPILLSGPLTLDAIRWNPQIFLRRHPWRVSDTLEPEAYRMRPDGSADWWNLDDPGSADDIERGVRSQMQHLDGQYLHWRTTSHPDWFNRRLLSGFLDDLDARGIRVVVVLVPVHPTAYDFYARQGGYDDSWIRSEMAGRGVTVIGAYSPWAAHVTREDFFDDVHVHPPVLHRLLAEGGIVE
jgi:hypothetical protein